MKIGYACIPLSIVARTTRRLTLKNYSEDLLSTLIMNNLDDLLKILEFNNKNDIKMFRISSDIIPLGSHEINTFNWREQFKSKLSSIGTYIKENDMRVSMHPGQYTVLNSPDEKIVTKAINDLKYHSDFLDSLGINKSNKIILHIGGIYNSKEEARMRFIDNYNNLSKNIKDRLIIENDERNYSLDDVLSISYEASIPVVFDNLHDKCFDDNTYNLDEILERVKNTWTEYDGPPKTHYSQQDLNKKSGSHSRTIKILPFLDYINTASKYGIDVMLEVKDKDFSAIKVLNIIKEKEGFLNKDIKLSEFDRYKLYLIEKGIEIYNEAFKIVSLNSIKDFYIFLDDIYYNNTTDESINTALLEVYKILESYMNSKEINHFFKLRIEHKFNKAKEYLYKMAMKYSIDKLIHDYYFHY